MLGAGLRWNQGLGTKQSESRNKKERKKEKKRKRERGGGFASLFVLVSVLAVLLNGKSALRVEKAGCMRVRVAGECQQSLGKQW